MRGLIKGFLWLSTPKNNPLLFSSRLSPSWETTGTWGKCAATRRERTTLLRARSSPWTKRVGRGQPRTRWHAGTARNAWADHLVDRRLVEYDRRVFFGPCKRHR